MFNFLNFITKEKEFRREERAKINEMRIRRLELLNEGKDPYVPNPRGIRWGYHIITADGEIIEKK